MKTVGVGPVEASNMRRNRNSGWTVLAPILLGFSVLPFALAQEKAVDTTVKTTASKALIDVIVADRHRPQFPSPKTPHLPPYIDRLPHTLHAFLAAPDPPS